MWNFNPFKRKEVAIGIPHSKLELCFTDSCGCKYYKFPEAMSLPVERFGKLQEFMMWMSAGLTSNELDILLDEAEKALMTCMIDKKGFAKIGFILTQIRERKTMVIHTELLYNFLAVQVIRQDEQAEHFNNAIHLEKIEQFKKETSDGRTYDFFLQTGLKKLNDLFNMSEAEWTRFWGESLEAQKLLLESVKIISKSESVNTAPVSMSK